MSELKRFTHGLAVGLGKALTPLLPDKSPVTLIGENAAEDLCDAIVQAGLSKPLIVTDAMLQEIGIVGRITSKLEAVGAQPVVYAGVEPDPTFSQVDDGLAMYRDGGCDCVLALGGGSPMDAAKVIAARVTNAKPIEQLEGLFKVRIPPPPLYAIPTTAGTGSEATYAAVVSDPVNHMKKFVVDPKLVPSMAALDPTLMTGLPPAVTAATGMDALTHAIESYVSQTATPATRRLSKAAVKLVFDNLPVAYSDGGNVEARKNMAVASFYAGMAFTRTSVGYVHAIAHTFGALYKTPHGLANAIVLPHILEFSKQHAHAQLEELADLIGVTGDSKPDAFIAAVRELKEKVEIAETLPALKSGDIDVITERALAEAHMNYPVPRYMTPPECRSILTSMLDG